MDCQANNLNWQNQALGYSFNYILTMRITILIFMLIIELTTMSLSL